MGKKTRHPKPKARAKKPQGINAICPTCLMPFLEHERLLLGKRAGCRGWFFGTNRK